MSKFADVTFQQQRGFVADVKAWKERGLFEVKKCIQREKKDNLSISHSDFFRT